MEEIVRMCCACNRLAGHGKDYLVTGDPEPKWVVVGEKSTLRFGVFEFDPRAGELRKKGMKIRLQGQPVDILAMLLEHRVTSSPGENFKGNYGLLIPL
jgi:DNA-binding response OmpR family regulator